MQMPWMIDFGLSVCGRSAAPSCLQCAARKMHDQDLAMHRLYQSYGNANNRLCEYANPVQTCEECAPRMISLKGRLARALQSAAKRIVTLSPNVMRKLVAFNSQFESALRV